jgi:hypothetical protein
VAESSGSNSSSTIGANLKEVYADGKKPKKFKKLLSLMGK